MITKKDDILNLRINGVTHLFKALVDFDLIECCMDYCKNHNLNNSKADIYEQFQRWMIDNGYVSGVMYLDSELRDIIAVSWRKLQGKD